MGGFFMQANDKKNIAILCNPLAGVGKAVILAEKIVVAIATRNMSYALFKETWPENFNGFTDIWIAGGDGTLNYFFNHYKEIKLPLVIFKGGTGNDFHWMLYGEMVIEEQLQIALTATPRSIDLGCCNEKYFINGVGVGFEGEVAKGLTGKNKKAGKASFMAMIIKKIFSYRSKYYQLSIDNKASVSKKYMIIDVSNGCRAGGGFHIAPEAKANDGFFDVVLIDALHPLKRLRWLPVIEKGKHLQLPFIKHSLAKKIIIESNELIQYHLDGEYFTSHKLEIEIKPGIRLFRY